MKILPDVALTYDDVLLVPQYSDVDSRRALSTTSWLTKKIALQAQENAVAWCLEQHGVRFLHTFFARDRRLLPGDPGQRVGGGRDRAQERRRHRDAADAASSTNSGVLSNRSYVRDSRNSLWPV